MNENKTIRWLGGTKLGALAVAGCLTVLPAIAAGPFSVRRAQNPAAVNDGSPVAVVASGPFDDDPSRLADGLSYFYTVSDASGAPLALSVHADKAAGLLRIGFDDDNPTSAAVNAALSTVTATPAAIPADGVTAATVTIVPRDVAGAPLGAGLAVSIGSSALWPGRVMGAIADLGDGRYVARVASPFAGTGVVAVSVEGLALAQEPQIVFEPFAESGSLRDLAIHRLADLVGPDGPFEATLASTDPASPAAVAFSEALGNARSALAQLVDGGPVRDDNAMKPYIEDAISNLLAAIAASPEAPVEAVWLVDDLVEIARMVALHHLNLATASCGSCDAARLTPVKVCAAEGLYWSGNDLRASTGPSLIDAVHQYALSVGQSILAQSRCR